VESGPRVLTDEAPVALVTTPPSRVLASSRCGCLSWDVIGRMQHICADFRTYAEQTGGRL